MVSGINWNSYSTTQIIQMHQMGVEVPQDVLAQATTTSATNFETNDEVTREAADIELEEFMNSEEFQDGKKIDKVRMLGEAQESKYKAAFEASNSAANISESLGTINMAIKDRAIVLDTKIAEMANNGASAEDINAEYKKASADMQNLAGGASARSSELKNLREKAIVAETFAEKAGEQANKLISEKNEWKKAFTTLTLGLCWIKGKNYKDAEHVRDRSEHILPETQAMQQRSQETLTSMSTIASNAGNFIQTYNSNVTANTESKEDENKKPNNTLDLM